MHVTETHRRCSKCREWKVHAAYNPTRGECKACQAHARKRWEVRRPPEALKRERERRHARQTARRQERKRERLQDARFAIHGMQAHGLSLHAISKRANVYRGSVDRIVTGEARYVHPRTVKKLYAALRQER